MLSIIGPVLRVVNEKMPPSLRPRNPVRSLPHWSTRMAPQPFALLPHSPVSDLSQSAFSTVSIILLRTPVPTRHVEIAPSPPKTRRSHPWLQ